MFTARYELIPSIKQITFRLLKVRRALLPPLWTTPRTIKKYTFYVTTTKYNKPTIVQQSNKNTTPTSDTQFATEQLLQEKLDHLPLLHVSFLLLPQPINLEYKLVRVTKAASVV